MDIPKFNDLTKSKDGIDVEDDQGNIIKFLPLRANRGSGDKINCIYIEGVSKADIKPGTQYYVNFKGNQLGASFNQIGTHQSMTKATLFTIVPSPEFWQ